ncbi:MAG: hypothetical protein UT42_C0019G0013 [Candidatus Falkowbacteria bacterium GW2011_GWA2_39_24]|uniref:Integral membrane protein TerC n=1 Tax=Candidatus Falkowbacteria bacterium GW2011_GWA2_39_24 TaxID=1618634 RepID=A0A0G0RMD6_9BACT|nr:MAG: hypothetical protein UT42_C0019G0013 [Candidatus Falkowbacteria bacterium GW2011_GWA2_39_24]
MDIPSLILILFGLCLFEIVSSLDNAVINADVLTTMSQKARRWFLVWGIIFAVFVVRGLLPWVIVWLTNTNLGFLGSLTATFSQDPHVLEAIEKSSPILLIGGGIFLLFIFLHWLFLETKNFGLRGEQFIFKQGVWFYAVASIMLMVVVWMALKINPYIAFGAVVGSTAFFITHGFRQNAEKAETSMMSKGHMSDISKILYLEVIDASFSIDGVLGAFAFTLSVPLIILGNGLGAFIVRELTIRNIEGIKKYIYLKNGAMYSIFFLGLVMVLDSFGFDIPSWLTPIITFAIIGYFFWKSKISLKKIQNIVAN